MPATHGECSAWSACAGANSVANNAPCDVLIVKTEDLQTNVAPSP